MTSTTPGPKITLSALALESADRRALQRMQRLARFADDAHASLVPLGLIAPMTKRQYLRLGREERLERLYLGVREQIIQDGIAKREARLEEKRRAANAAKAAADIARAAATTPAPAEHEAAPASARPKSIPARYFVPCAHPDCNEFAVARSPMPTLKRCPTHTGLR